VLHRRVKLLDNDGFIGKANVEADLGDAKLELIYVNVVEEEGWNNGRP